MRSMCAVGMLVLCWGAVVRARVKREDGEDVMFCHVQGGRSWWW